jgi:hypothetical protein
MAQICKETQEWIEEQIEKPIEDWENRQEQRCRDAECNWWTLCLNKLFCWLVVIVVKIVRIILVTVGKWVSRIVCEIVNVILDVAGALVSLILSIPILGGIIRAILNWVTEIFWRLVGVFDFVGSLLGIRPQKKMHFSIIIPTKIDKPIDHKTVEQIMDIHVREAQRVFNDLCNVTLINTGICKLANDIPDSALNPTCTAGGYFDDWGIAGTYFELGTLTCKYQDNWRRIVGYGGQISVFVVANVNEDTATSTTIGCSFSANNNYIVIEPVLSEKDSHRTMATAHEIGHACLLLHSSDDDKNNLMFPSNLVEFPELSNFQISWLRSSKHCTYL